MSHSQLVPPTQQPTCLKCSHRPKTSSSNDSYNNKRKTSHSIRAEIKSGLTEALTSCVLRRLSFSCRELQARVIVIFQSAEE